MSASVGPNNPSQKRKRKRSSEVRNEVVESSGHRAKRQEPGALATEDQDETRASGLRVDLDKISTLPNELQSMILDYVSIKDLKSLMRASNIEVLFKIAKEKMLRNRRRLLADDKGGRQVFVKIIHVVASSLAGHMKDATEKGLTPLPLALPVEKITSGMNKIIREVDKIDENQPPTYIRLQGLCEKMKRLYLIFDVEMNLQGVADMKSYETLLKDNNLVVPRVELGELARYRAHTACGLWIAGLGLHNPTYP